MGFEKGKSGNPGGRPKIAEEFSRKARAAVDEHVLQAWIDELQVRTRIVRDRFGAERAVEQRGEEWMRASENLAAYGYGKPAQSVDVTSGGDKIETPVAPQVIIIGGKEYRF